MTKEKEENLIEAINHINTCSGCGLCSLIDEQKLREKYQTYLLTKFKN